jgi:uncharacterized membrane protein
LPEQTCDDVQQEEPQRVVPAVQAQLPPEQVCPVGHALPQLPQLLLSLLESRQVPAQQSPLWHCPLIWHAVVLLVAIFDEQAAPTQTWLPVQGFVAPVSQWPAESQDGAMTEA